MLILEEKDQSARFSHLHSSVKDAASNLHHLQVLLLLIASALDIRHPTSVVLLTGINEAADSSIVIENLQTQETQMLTLSLK